MGRTKRLKELTIKDNFMFGAVMMDEDNCKGLLERVLEIQIDRVDVSKEKSIVYHPEYKGVRLDVYAKDEKNTRYTVDSRWYYLDIPVNIINSDGLVQNPGY